MIHDLFHRYRKQLHKLVPKLSESSSMISPTRCRVQWLNGSDLDRAADDPGLAHLISAGWEPMAFAPVEQKDGSQGIALIMKPPAYSAFSRLVPVLNALVLAAILWRVW